MRKIDFIAPIAGMRGNISGRQTLVYNENANRAWLAPDGVQRPLAYQPRLIAARRSRDGHYYFMVRTKSAQNWKESTRANTAFFAGACAVYAAVCADSALRALVESVKRVVEPGKTLREYLLPKLREMLAQGASDLDEMAGGYNFVIDNPWQVENPNVNVPETIYNKYKDLLEE